MSSSQECHSYQSSRNCVAKLLALGHSKFWSPGSKKLYTSPAKSLIQKRSSMRFFCFFPVLSWMVADHTPLGKTVTSSTDSLDCCLEPCLELALEGTCLEPDLQGDTGSKSEVKRKSSETHDSFLASWISRIFVPNRMLVIYPTISNHVQPPPAMSFHRRSSPNWHFTCSTPPPFVVRVPLRGAARIWATPIHLIVLPQVIPGAHAGMAMEANGHDWFFFAHIFFGEEGTKDWLFFVG